MRIEQSIAKALDDIDDGHYEAAMMHACNAADGTSCRPDDVHSTKTRFKDFVRAEAEVIAVMGLPGLDVIRSRFDVDESLVSRTGGAQYVDLADILYAVHRCSHAHGKGIPEGFELTETPGFILHVERRTLMLPRSLVFGLLAAAVLSPLNADLHIGDPYKLWYTPPGPTPTTLAMPLSEWFGRRDDFLAFASRWPRSEVTVTGDGPWEVKVPDSSQRVEVVSTFDEPPE